MSLPKSDDLKGMEFAFLAQPFVNVPAKPAIETNTMDYAFLAQPFVTNPASSEVSEENAIFFGFVA
jgi:hypothetical protein